MIEKKPSSAGRAASWTTIAFYLLVAFEFFYMASPFAVYCYSIYRPGLDILGASRGLGWLAAFFLPHIAVETKSVLLDHRNLVGAVVAGGGFLLFCVGAGQVYYAKLRRKGVVSGGVYRLIRHPQYTSLAISGLGLLILWPRYLALLGYLAVLLAYLLLAVLEERECERKFGQAYVEYLSRTGRFLPFRLRWFRSLTESRQRAIAAALVVIAIPAAFLSARLVERWAVGRLYIHTTSDSTYLSLARMTAEEFQTLASIVAGDEEIQGRLERRNDDGNSRLLTYVLPPEWYVSEIPMHPVANSGFHHAPDRVGAGQYRIVVTSPTVRGDVEVSGGDLLRRAVFTVPQLEAVVDLEERRVISVVEPILGGRYQGIPVPVY